MADVVEKASKNSIVVVGDCDDDDGVCSSVLGYVVTFLTAKGWRIHHYRRDDKLPSAIHVSAAMIADATDRAWIKRVGDKVNGECKHVLTADRDVDLSGEAYDELLRAFPVAEVTDDPQSFIEAVDSGN